MFAQKHLTNNVLALNKYLVEQTAELEKLQKFNSLQNEIDTHKSEITKMYNEEKKLHSVIKSLEKDIAGLKKEVWKSSFFVEFESYSYYS